MEERMDASAWGIRDVVDGTFRVYRKHFLSIWTFSFVVTLPYLLWDEWVWMHDGEWGGSAPFTVEENILVFLVGSAVWSVIIFPILQNGLTGILRQQKLTVKSLFQFAVRKWLQVFLAHGLVSVLFMLLLLGITSTIGVTLYITVQNDLATTDPYVIESIFYLCYAMALLPSAYVLGKFSLVIPLLKHENIPFWSSFTRSFHWVGKDGIRVMAGILLLTCIEIPLFFVSFLVEEGALNLLRMSSQMAFGFSGLFRIFASTFTAPLVPIFFNLLYTHYHRKRLGTDLILLLERIDQRSGNWIKRANS